jgi:hypothetical protein
LALSDDQLDQLVELQNRLREKHRTLVQQLSTGQINKDVFLEETERALEAFMLAACARVGNESYEKLFDDGSTDPSWLIDRQTLDK